MDCVCGPSILYLVISYRVLRITVFRAYVKNITRMIRRKIVFKNSLK